MKRKIWKLLSLTLAAGMLLSGCGAETKTEKKSIRIGVGLYRGDDTFISDLSAELQLRAKEYEQETGTRITLDIESAKGSQSTQNSQVERFLSLGCDVICMNPVDRMAVSLMIENAMDADVPIVFFNREPAEEDLGRWDKLYYVGVDARETAELQGQIVLEHYEADPERFDRNGDGVVSYVLLEGESSHQDSLIRTEVSIQTIMDGGMPIRRVTGGIANWERIQAAALMEQWLKEYPDEIELIISNNDDMALGAIDTLEREKVTDIEVVGIDGTVNGLSAVKNGKMIGTVENDLELYSRSVFDLAIALSEGDISESGVELEDDKYFWVQQKIVNAEDYQ